MGVGVGGCGGRRSLPVHLLSPGSHGKKNALSQVSDEYLNIFASVCTSLINFF